MKDKTNNTNTKEKTFTKYVESEISNDIDMVDELANKGWVMCGTTYNKETKRYIYWFQSKRKIYEKMRSKLNRGDNI